ncbi:hypothetical protein L484_004423 [Morus notabilis]|uniref:FAS1 domain-containing protein n=1 Tax=Morus notabilis TaxID=981085 RepID=W9S8I4_9ROSA|nr:fasciclin-like arabinogalactan protein 14 [Morus notabilis]EXB94232.1 hypothetical protein L484_004423 [Morus notabilis]
MKNPKASPLLFLSLLLLLLSFSSAFNITKILSQHPEFATFNGFLSQTKLADEINRRQTITVLVVDNAAASSLSGKPLDVVKKILSVHVILDYYDVEKLTKLGISNKTSALTTLLAGAGAADQRGFINVSLVNEGEIAFGSSAKGGALNSKLVESVAAHPFNISVLQITAPVQVPGIESTPVGTPPPKPSAAPVPAPKKSPAAAPAKPVAPVPSRKSGAPAPSEVVIEVPVEAPISDAPFADGPESDAPVTDAPVSSPPKPKDTADAEAPTQRIIASGGSRREMAVGVGVLAAALVSCFVA